MTRLLISIVFIILSQMAYANFQRKGIVEGEIIVRFPQSSSPSWVEKKLNSNGYRLKEIISPSLNLYLVQTDQPVEKAIKKLKESESIFYAQPNHYVQLREAVNSNEFNIQDLLRGIPNDPQMNQMWNLIDSSLGTGGISANLAWNTSVGGKDKGGNDIVVPVVDGGVDMTHPDLKQNAWVNKNEIPNNGIDDDGNGFIDDVYGWKSFADNGNISADGHATHVAGTIGAAGNNGVGVSGVNWNVKIMSIMGASGTTATVAKA